MYNAKEYFGHWIFNELEYSVLWEAEKEYFGHAYA